jgi:hypothetical protein
MGATIHLWRLGRELITTPDLLPVLLASCRDVLYLVPTERPIPPSHRQRRHR